MVSNIVLSFNVVTPLFLEMLLGLFLRKVGLLSEETSASLNKLIFKCFLPILIFTNIYNSNVESMTDFTYITFGVVAVIIVFAVLMVVVPIFEKDKRKCGVIIQAGFRSNFVLFGIPVTSQLLGDDHIGPASLMIAILIPVFNILAVADLEFFRGKTMNIKNVLKGIVTNPLIIASVLGILVNLSGFRFISSVESTLTGVSRIATPLALIVLGSDFKIDAVKDYWKQLSAGLCLRLILVPAVTLSIAALMGIRGEHFVTLMTAFASPVAVNSYIMAEMMDGDSVLASQLVFYSTGLSILTLFFFIFVTKTLGMF